MGKHGKASCLNVEKKDSFFYNAVSRSFDFKKAESFGDRDLVCRFLRLNVMI